MYIVLLYIIKIINVPIKLNGYVKFEKKYN